ncbi:MAG: phosphotransferase enzyme family protein [Nitrospinales bacterium]
MIIPQEKIDLYFIAEQFDIHGDVDEIIPFGSGHIHDTYLIKTAGKNTPDYILQKINHQIFRDIDGLMSNISVVTSHIKSKLLTVKGTESQKQTVELVRSGDGDLFSEISGNYWRAFIFISDSYTYQIVQNNKQAYEAGKIIGGFQYLLSDIGTDLHVTIPGFHDLELRLEQFNLAATKDLKTRVQLVKDEIRFVKEMTDLLRPFLDLLKSGKVPVRITHYDTKLDNILFDKNDHAICLIDLDTVMPGYIFYDFGDAARTMANDADEDEEDLSKVGFNKNYYQALLDGYLEETTTFISKVEKDWLSYSSFYMAFLMGLRFLTDFINGDIYYKTDFPEHNLVRARCQFELIRKMEVLLI